MLTRFTVPELYDRTQGINHCKAGLPQLLGLLFNLPRLAFDNALHTETPLVKLYRILHTPSDYTWVERFVNHIIHAHIIAFINNLIGILRSD